MIEQKFPKEVWCEEGWDCLHFQIGDLVRELNLCQIKNGEVPEFKEKLKRLEKLIKKFEAKLLPLLDQDVPKSSLPCHHPYMMRWGRIFYEKNFQRLQATQQSLAAKPKAKKKIRQKKI